MAEIVRSQLLEGVWTGEVSGMGESAVVQVFLGNDRVENVDFAPGVDGIMVVQVPIPTWALADGVQNFVLKTDDNIQVGAFTIIAGNAVADDLRAEIGLLRAELDMLKKAFRQHVVATEP